MITIEEVRKYVAWVNSAGGMPTVNVYKKDMAEFSIFQNEEIERLRAANKDALAWFEDLKVEFDKVRRERDDAYLACGIVTKSGEPK